MKKRKSTNNYYFSVEGENEKQYFVWLQQTINSENKRTCNVSFDIKVKKDPYSYVKSLKVLTAQTIFHITDIEGKSAHDINVFKKELDAMDEVKKRESNRVKDYLLGYSNLTFELWMVLQKQVANKHVANKQEYVTMINKAYNKTFVGLSDLKNAKNFATLLQALTINDVYAGIKRAQTLLDIKIRNNEILQEYRKYTYYANNPALSIHIIISKILKEAGLGQHN